MSVPGGGGGFNFGIGFITSAASAALQSLGQQVQQFSAAAQAAFNKATPNFQTQQAAQQLNNLQQQINKLGNVRVNLELQGWQETATGLRTITNLANNLSSQRAVVSLDLNDNRFSQEIARARQLLASLQRGDTAVLNLRMNDGNLRAAMTALRADIRNIEQRGVNLTVNASPSSGGLLQSILGGAGRGAVAGSGIGGNLLIGAGGLTTAAAAGVGAAVAVEKLTSAVVAAAQAGIEYNARLETQVNTFRHFTSSAAEAAEVMQSLRQIATRSPFGEQQVLTAGAAFTRANPGDTQRARELTELTVALAAAHPELGFERMQQAMQQLVSGDFRAFEDSTNIAIGSVRQLAATGITGMELYRRAVAQAGGSTELLNANMNTFQARMTTMQSAAAALNGAFTRGAFEEFSASIGGVNAVTGESREALMSVANFLGGAFVIAIKTALPILELLKNNLLLTAQAARFLKDNGIIAGGPSSSDKPGVGGPGSPSAEDPTKRTVGRPEQIQANKRAQEELQGQIAKETIEHERIERLLHSKQAQVKAITGEYAAQLIPLQDQQRQLQQPNFGLQRARVQNAQQANAAAANLERAQGPIYERAQIAGVQARLQVEREGLDIQRERRELTRSVQDAEERVYQDQLQATVRLREASIDRLQREHQDHQAVRQAALERLRDEAAAHQAVRQAAIERLREEARQHSEARSLALEGAREEARANQEARREVLDGLREEIRARQETRREALEGIQEEIRARRDAVAEALDARRQEQQVAEHAYQEEIRYLDEVHRIQQNNFRDQIEALQERDRRLQQQERGDTPAERELKALELLQSARQRAQTLQDAEYSVINARTGRERREALHRLEEIKQQQALEQQKEQLQAQAEKERKAREDAQYARQEKIRQLERQAAQEDRAFQEAARQEENRHRAEQYAQQEAERQAANEERQLQRQEDAQVREIERANKEQERQEAAQIREAERADRRAQQQEEAGIRAQEAANRAADRAEQAALRQAEQADREATRAEQERIRQQEAIDKAADRAEEAEIRRQQRELADIQRQNAERTAAIQGPRNAEDLDFARQMADLEGRRLDARQRLVDLKDIPLLGAATADATLAELIGKAIDFAIKADELTKELAGIDIAEKIAEIDNNIAIKTQDLRISAAELEGQLALSQSKIDGMKAALEELQRQFTSLTAAPTADVPRDDWKTEDHNKNTSVAAQGGAKWAKDFVGTFAAESKTLLVDVPSDLMGWLVQGISNWLQGDTATDRAMRDWADKNIRQSGQDALEENSPSKMSEQWGIWLGEGFIEGINSTVDQINEALRTPFTAFEADFLTTLAPTWGQYAIDSAQAFADEITNSPAWEQLLTQFQTAATDGAQAWATAFTDAQPTIQDAVFSTMDALLADLGSLYPPKFTETGSAAGDAWAEGYRLSSEGQGLTVASVMDYILQVIDTYGPSFEVEGGNMAINFQNGWTNMMAQWQPYVPDTGGGGYGGGAASSPSYQYYGSNGGSGRSPGAEPYNYYDSDPYYGQRPKSYDTGGMYTPGIPRLLHANELDIPTQGGSVLPDEVVRGVSVLANIGRGSTSGGGSNITLHITNYIQGSDDPDAVANVVADKIIDALDRTQQQTAKAVDRVLPGAV